MSSSKRSSALGGGSARDGPGRDPGAGTGPRSFGSGRKNDSGTLIGRMITVSSAADGGGADGTRGAGGTTTGPACRGIDRGRIRRPPACSRRLWRSYNSAIA